jgi:hypothetical protein
MSDPTGEEAGKDGRGTLEGRKRSRTLGRLTQFLAGIIVVGVVMQAAVAGGFLAGRPTFRTIHEHLGYGLLLAGFALLTAGLLGRRSQSAAALLIPTRAALALTLALTVFAGMRSSRGSSDLLILHLPLSFAILALGVRLLLLSPSRSTSAGGLARLHEPRTGDPPDG